MDIAGSGWILLRRQLKGRSSDSTGARNELRLRMIEIEKSPGLSTIGFSRSNYSLAAYSILVMRQLVTSLTRPTISYNPHSSYFRMTRG